LDRGTKLGPYEILDLIGAGGMGEVYKARDTRLDRIVAIKLLPARFADHAEFRQRLEREARAVSSLNHAHICTLYDVGRQNDTNFLILEYLEGETLSARLKKGRLPTDTALRYAIEIASALDAAHRRGVVHRDLKPGNIMLTRSGSKLLDFGLARIRDVKKPENDATASLTGDLTAQGTILGTYRYMAPEQIEGKESDARADIFAFGAVLYEMLTGRPAFAGDSQASLIAAILTAHPPRATNPPEGPLERALRTCLAKDPDERWQSAADLVRELRWIEAKPSEPAQMAWVAPRGSGLIAWIVAAAATAGLLSLSWIHFRQPTADHTTMRFTIPTEARLPSQVQISPDGSNLIFRGQNAQGKPMLWLRSLNKLQAQPLPATEDGLFPFWSPDSRHIAFFGDHDGKLKRVDLTGGQPQILCEAPLAGGGDWGPDGTILFAPERSSGIYRVPAGGGVPVQITKPGKIRSGHSSPVFLPDRKHFLYFERPDYLQSKDRQGSMWVATLNGKESKQLLAASSPALVAAAPDSTSYLLFVRNGVLLAQEVDLANLQLRGQVIRVTDSIAIDAAHNEADVSVSRTGTLALNSAVYQHELVWLDRSGNRLGAGIPVDKYAQPYLAPNGRQALFQRMDPKIGAFSLWKLDVERGETSLFASDATHGVFFPDGGSVVFRCQVSGEAAFCRKSSGGAIPEEKFWQEKDAIKPTDISSDGRFLSYDKMGASYGLSASIWILPLTAERRPYRFYPSDAEQHHGIFAPNGKWIAYTSHETGDAELYVQPFPATGEKWKISAHGGAQPRWRRDGNELYYRTVDGKMMAVPIKTAGGFEAGAPKMLFQSSADPLYPNLSIPYDVSDDGKKFLVNAAADETRSSPITVITNWTAGLQR
jgi:serine/threonine protein kinase